MNYSIRTNEELYFENLASLRVVTKTVELELELRRFVEYLKGKGANKNGPLISATFNLIENDGAQFIDIEFLIPIDKPITVDEPYKFKPVFHLKNAITTKYIGNPQHVEDAYIELKNYLEENQLHQITAAYNVNRENQSNHEEQAVIDLYIGVNPSIL